MCVYAFSLLYNTLQIWINIGMTKCPVTEMLVEYVTIRMHQNKETYRNVSWSFNI